MQIEKEQVLKPCLKLCKQLLNSHIIKYRRLDALDYYHENGDPDIEIWINHKNHIFIIMAECKKPIGGIFSLSQKKYENKYKIFDNVLYIGITDVIQLKEIILKLSHYQNKEIEFFMKEEL